MAKKTEHTFDAYIELNEEKGGAWLATCQLSYLDEEGEAVSRVLVHTPWKNAAAAKRWVKKMVLELTPRKSVKMNPKRIIEVEGKEKVTSYSGELKFKE